MLQSLFPYYVQKWFTALIVGIVSTINGTKEEPRYLFKQMLKESYSTDLKWGSLSSGGYIVAADIVPMNSSLPLKKRDSMGKATGDIPKAGMKFYLTEKQLSDIDIMVAKGTKESEIVKKIFADSKRCVAGVEETLEYMFLNALSTGYALVPDDSRPGIAIKADFGHPDDQKFGVKVKWESGATILGNDDIQNVLSRAIDKGTTLRYILLDGPTLNILRNSAQIKTLYASSISISDPTNVATPTNSKLRELILDEFGLEIVVIDRVVYFEKDGVRTASKPWQAGSVAFLGSMDAGELQYGTLAEENHPVADVAYEKAGSYTLVSKYRKNDPLREFTSSQALVIPVIDIDNLWLMDTTEAQEVDSGETEGDSTITIWSTSLTKADVIAAVEALDITVDADITDVNLIKLINTLSDKQEKALKSALEVS